MASPLFENEHCELSASKRIVDRTETNVKYELLSSESKKCTSFTLDVGFTY